MTTTTITVDIALLLLVSSHLAQWGKIIIDARRSRSNGKAHQSHPCDNATAKERGERITRNETNIGNLSSGLNQFRAENREDHDEIKGMITESRRAGAKVKG